MVQGDAFPEGVWPVTREEVTDLLRESVEAFNAIHGEIQLAFAPETPLFGDGAPLSSLDLVMLLVEIEDRLADRFGLERSLSDDRAMSQQRSPFRTIGTLTDYLAALGADPHE
jgi:acyl carrier protein